MRLFIYDMLVNVMYYVHVCEQARWARSVGNSAIENLCIIYYWVLSIQQQRICSLFWLGPVTSEELAEEVILPDYLNFIIHDY